MANYITNITEDRWGNMVHVIDYGLGNLGSVHNMLGRLGFQSKITNDPMDLENATHLILPGVGAFDTGVNELKNRGLWQSLQEHVIGKQIPVLGICLGMQLLSAGSEEGDEKGLGWIDARFLRFPSIGHDGEKLRVPNVGWNYVQIVEENELTHELPGEPRFYFVHSYYAEMNDPSQAFMTCNYDGFGYVCAYKKAHIWGVQFHPEKSHAFGMQLLKNFASL